MSRYVRHGAPVLVALALGAAACSRGKDDSAALKQDSALSRDLALANQDTAAQPQLQDVPANNAATPAPTPSTSAPRTTTSASSGTTVRTRPRTPTPAPRTPAATTPAAPRTTPSGNTVTPNAGGGGGGGAVGTIAAGTSLSLASNSKVCTNTNHVGERFSATLINAVSGSNGATIPAGATATVEITQLKRSENANDKIQMGFRVVSITFGGRTYALDATTESADIQRVRNEPAAKDRQKVIGGAIAGAIAGRILGKNTKGAVIGAATGAAAGAATAAATANYEGCLNDGGNLVVKLTDAAQVRI